MFVMWCGTNPALDYNGAFVLSRHKTQASISQETEQVFREVATKHGVDYDAMCVSDNTQCPDNPWPVVEVVFIILWYCIINQ